MEKLKISDYQITAESKRVLMANWIDPGSIFTRSAGGVLAVEGIMKMLNGDIYSVGPQLMDKIDQQLGDIKGVKMVRYRLENMVRVDRCWKHVQMKDNKRTRLNVINTEGFKGIRSLRETLAEKAKKENEEKTKQAEGRGGSG